MTGLKTDLRSTFQILFYALRPGFIRSQRLTIWHAYNIFAILAFDCALVQLWGKNALIYLIMSSFFAGSLHPCAAHFIAEHYLMNNEQIVPGSPQDLAKETTSYYGWLNVLCYNVSCPWIPEPAGEAGSGPEFSPLHTGSDAGNFYRPDFMSGLLLILQVGYHNEHHDFPSIPWTRLPALRAIAKEFYEPLPAHTSWPYVTWKFITDPSVGMWSRAKRDNKGEKMDQRVWERMAGVAQASDEDVDVSASEEDEERAYASDSGQRCKTE